MIHSVKFTCVLDTNVIYPIDVRDLLFWFASYDLYTPKWSKHIFDEWEDVMKRKGVPENEILKRVNKANLAFPGALVENYEFLVSSLKLPDEKDRHVLAAAIKCNAHLIISNNLSDFPLDYLSSFDLSVKSADEFISDTIDLDNSLALEAFQALVLNRTQPNLNEFEMLERLKKNGLIQSANYLQSLL